MTYLRVTTIPGRFTEVLDLQVTATGRAVLNRLRSGGRRPGWPGSDYARYRCPPPSDRSPTQDPPARPGASQEDTAGSPGYNLWITRQIVHRQPAPLYTKITALSTGLRKAVSQTKCFEHDASDFRLNKAEEPYSILRSIIFLFKLLLKVLLCKNIFRYDPRSCSEALVPGRLTCSLSFESRAKDFYSLLRKDFEFQI